MNYLEHRLSGTFNVSPTLTIEGAAGKNNQFMHQLIGFQGVEWLYLTRTLTTQMRLSKLLRLSSDKNMIFAFV